MKLLAVGASFHQYALPLVLLISTSIDLHFILQNISVKSKGQESAISSLISTSIGEHYMPLVAEVSGIVCSAISSLSWVSLS